MPIAPGTRLGRFEIRSLLGAGGMGEVYLAHDTRLKRSVALKLLPAEWTRNEDRVRRFEQEANAASALNHPNILTIYEVGQTDVANFIASEYIDGHTLREQMENTWMKLSDVLDVATQVASALAAAHTVGIVHRDIKPENIMVRKDGYIKVLDFGLAKLIEGQSSAVDSDAPTAPLFRTEPGTVMGTPRYMSPEQTREVAVDARTDIWSLGVVLYEMVAGRAPFEGPTVGDYIASILHNEPPPLVRYREEVPPKLQRIISQALRKEREQRYHTIKQMLVDLQSLKQDLEFAANKERSAQPNPVDSATLTGTSTHIRLDTGGANAALPTGAVEAAHTGTSSAEYIVSEIKRHKLSALLVSTIFVMVVAGIAFGFYRFINQNETNKPVLETKVIPFTSFPGRERHPAFSFDGNFVAFVWSGEKGDNNDIYVKLIDGGTPLRLTTNPRNEWFPTWSPDGRRIAFIRESENAIFTVPALGGPERKLFSATASDPFLIGNGLSWSPDGKLLAFIGKETPQEPNGIYLLTVETGAKRRLTSPPAQYQGDTRAAFSPDGQTVAFTRWVESGITDVHLVSTGGGEPRRLTSDNQSMSGVAWSDDGREVVFSSNRGGSFSLWKISISGGAPERLSTGQENSSGPAISRLGHRLAYVQDALDTNIWRVEVPSSTGQRTSAIKFISSTREDISPQYSSDGKRIVFASDRSGSREIWMCDREGANLVQLTFFSGPEVGTPRWSPDSRSVVFDRTIDGHKDIYVLSPEGGSPRRLTTETSNEVRPSWSRDGRWIYFGSNRSGEWQVWKMPADGGQGVQVTTQGGREAFESADSRFVYYTNDRNLPGLWRIPVEGGEAVRVHNEASMGLWAVMERGVYLLNSKANARPALEYFDFQTGRTTQLATLDKELDVRVPGLAISPDGQSILYVQIDQHESDILLAENFR
ncbi:MAG: protein kinase [Acidobacteriota bacterium]|nr:protein kinase [Acidobacteriota bacterium]